MFFRLSFVVGTILSLLFVLFCLYYLFSDESGNSAGLFVSVLFMTANSFFLLSNFLCIKINKCNKEQVLISRNLKNTGKVLVVLTIISIVIVLLCGIAALLSRLYSDKIIPEKHALYFFLLISLLLLSGILAIINLIYFRKVSRRNKIVINKLIDDIQLT